MSIIEHSTRLSDVREITNKTFNHCKVNELVKKAWAFVSFFLWRLIVLLVFSLTLNQFSFNNLYAEESEESSDPELYITANRYASSRDEIGSSFTVITREEIEKSQKTSFGGLADCFRS